MLENTLINRKSAGKIFSYRFLSFIFSQDKNRLVILNREIQMQIHFHLDLGLSCY